jgi:hypothetical protein
MTIPLKPASKSAARVLEKLIEGLDEPGDARKIDNSGGTYMPVHVECVGRSEHGLLFSIAHYFEAHGDLVADPDCVLLVDDAGNWYPISITMTFGRKVCLTLGEGQKPRVDEREYRAQSSFLTTWTRNIKEQQGL